MKYKALYLLFFAFFGTYNIVAFDVKSNQRHEIGLNVFNVFNPREVVRGGTYLYASTNMNYLNGIVYKYKFEKIAFHIGVDYYRYKYELNEVDVTRNGQQKFVEMRVGVERVFKNYTSNNKFSVKPFVRLDLYSAVGTDKGINNSESFTNSIFEAGIGPALGFRFYLSPKIHLSFEASGVLSVVDLNKLGNYPLIKQINMYYYSPKFMGINYSF